MNKFLTFVKKNKIIVAVVFIFVAVGAIFFFGDSEEVVEISSAKTKVETISVAELSSGALGIVVPTADSNAFVVRSESGGRVESAIETGAVTKGELIARLENSAQIAALTQAQGAYETALAGAEQSQFSVDTTNEGLAQTYTSAKSTLRSSLIDAENVMTNTVDTFFSGANYSRFGLSNHFWNKKQIEYDLTDWSNVANNDIANEDLVDNLEMAINVTDRIYALVNTIYNAVIDEENGADSSLLETLSTYRNDLLSARSTISGNLNTLRSTKLSVTSTESSVERARSNSTGGNTSAVDAQVKQALGVLQSAQAAYAKTLVKAPFSGTLTSVSVKTGDVIGVGSDIAIIVPEKGADTTKSFSLPLSAVKYTPAGAYVFVVNNEGVIESISVTTGLVTTTNINITGLNGDEVIIKDVRGLKAGDSVVVE